MGVYLQLRKRSAPPMRMKQLVLAAVLFTAGGRGFCCLAQSGMPRSVCHLVLKSQKRGPVLMSCSGTLIASDAILTSSSCLDVGATKAGTDNTVHWEYACP